MNRQLVAIEDNTVSKDRILRVEWNLGKRCNFDCSYCGASTHDKVSPHLEMPIVEKTLRRLVELSTKSGKALRLAFTGGEPYLHPRYMEILELAKTLGVERMSVTTNGSVLADTYIRSLDYLNHVIVSYHMEYAKREKVLHNIERIQDNIVERRLRGQWRGLHVHVMLLPGEFAEAEEVVARLKAREIEYVVRRIRPQFKEDGEYLRPFNSGLVGLFRGGPAKPRLPYYSAEEVQRMEVGF